MNRFKKAPVLFLLVIFLSVQNTMMGDSGSKKI